MNKLNKYFRHKLFIFIILITLVFVLASCGSSSNEAQNDGVSYDMAYSGAVEEYSRSGLTKEMSPSAPPVPAGNNAYQTEQMIIYNGSIYIDVVDIKEAAIEVEKAIKKVGGYLINSNISENDNRYYARYEYKVPVDDFFLLIDDISSMPIGKVKDQYTNGNDVTEEYLDIDSRLKAKRVYEARLLDLFEQAKSTEDLLKISNDLSRVQEEIEQLEGRQKYLSYHAANSTLTIEMQQFKDKVSPTATSWEKAVTGFVESLKFIKDLFVALFIWAVSSIPILILLTLLIVIIWLLLRNKIRNRKNIFTRRGKNDNSNTDETDNTDSNNKD